MKPPMTLQKNWVLLDLQVLRMSNNLHTRRLKGFKTNPEHFKHNSNRMVIIKTFNKSFFVKVNNRTFKVTDERKDQNKNKKVITKPNTSKGKAVKANRTMPKSIQKTTTKMLNKKNDMGRIPVGGRLFKFRASWKGAAHESVIKTGLSWTWSSTPPPLKEIHQKTSETLDAEIVKLRKKRVIEKAKSLKFQSRVFSVPKKDSLEERWVIDLSHLNACIVCPTFRMLTMREVKLLLPKGFWTVSLDLKDGFWHIPVSRRKRPYLGFKYRGQFWRFRAMPFGLNIAPRIFTKVMAHVIKILASEGIFVLIYLDDLLIVAPTEQQCAEHRDRAIALLIELGWIINTEKSRQQPAQIFDWLGVHLDLKAHTVRATQDTMDMYKRQLDLVIKSSSTTKRTLMRVQGLANWIGQTNQIARMLVAKTKVLLRKFRREHLDTQIVLSKGMKLSLIKWVYTPTIHQQLGNPLPTIIIQTDASLRGYGFQIDQTPFQGDFDQSMRNYSINTLELVTIWLALMKVTKENQIIHILCDNSTAVSAVRRSTTTVYHLAMISELIWRRATSMGWTLTVSHIQGKYNIVADQLSRNIALSTEWSLPPEAFKEIMMMNPHLQIDLFATRLNNQLKTYISPCPDRRAVAVDAMAIPWDRWDHLYLYPPSTMISKVLPKLLESRCKSAILITPDFPTRPWFMALRLRQIPSTLMSVHLQQMVVDKLEIAPTPTKLRVWKLSNKHTVDNSQIAQML